jgi:hypothetical protein
MLSNNDSGTSLDDSGTEAIFGIFGNGKADGLHLEAFKDTDFSASWLSKELRGTWG